MLLRAVTARSRGARKVRMLTRRRLLAGSALVTLASALPTSALAQVGPPPPPPPVIGGQAVTWKSHTNVFGQTVYIGIIAKTIAIILTAAYVSATQHRQLTFAEVVLAPFFFLANPTEEEIFYAMVAWAYDELPRRREELIMQDRGPRTYPPLKNMLAELKTTGITFKFTGKVVKAKPKKKKAKAA